MWELIIFGVLFLLAFEQVYSVITKRRRKSLKGRHVVITGGSSGIGKAAAIQVAQQGANVTIIARDVDKLDEAQQEIKSHVINDEQIITRIPVDVCHLEAVENNLLEVEETVGPIYMLLNCAGFAVCGKLENISPADIRNLVDVNLLGTIYPIKAVLPKFKARKEGIIVLTSSGVGLMGMFGYSVYSSCKFAIRGLAESLYMEVRPYNIGITMVLPPDTDTPGFHTENKTKPRETKLMSETAGLYSPEEVAKNLLDDALAGNFFSYVGFESWMLATLCVGMSPFQTIGKMLFQSLLLGPFRIIATFYIKYFEYIVAKCQSEDQVGKED